MRLLTPLLAFLCCIAMTSAQPILQIPTAPDLDKLVQRAVTAVVDEFSETKLKPEELAITLVDLRTPDQPRRGSHRGTEPIYPASVVKLFYLEAAHRWMDQGKIADTPELRRAMRDMIVDSYNEASHYIVDLLTDTTSGPELPPDEMRAWEHQRNAVNRYFAARGFENLNINQKPWCEGPYGRERIFVGEKYTNRNALTTDATAILTTEIVLGQAVNEKRSAEMLDLMKRDPFSETKDPDDQSHGFTGSAVPKGANLWSKAGWTSQTRHDAAYIELPNGAKFVLVTFTINHANERRIIPAIARVILEEFSN